jgi:hypothetical protein
MLRKGLAKVYREVFKFFFSFSVRKSTLIFAISFETATTISNI